MTREDLQRKLTALEFSWALAIDARNFERADWIGLEIEACEAAIKEKA